MNAYLTCFHLANSFAEVTGRIFLARHFLRDATWMLFVARWSSYDKRRMNPAMAVTLAERGEMPLHGNFFCSVALLRAELCQQHRPSVLNAIFAQRFLYKILKVCRDWK